MKTRINELLEKGYLLIAIFENYDSSEIGKYIESSRIAWKLIKKTTEQKLKDTNIIIKAENDAEAVEIALEHIDILDNNVLDEPLIIK